MSTYLSSSLEGVSGQPGDDLQCLSHFSGARPDHFQNIAQPMQQTGHQVALGEREIAGSGQVQRAGERQRGEVERNSRVRSGTESRRETGGRGGEK